MTSIFSDKNALKNEYIRLFLNYLSDFEAIINCVKSRYDKPITLDQLKAFFNKNDETLFAFIGENNRPRIQHFFGTYHTPDERDNKITLRDKFLFDCIHFEVIRILMNQLVAEYKANQIAIDNAWRDELSIYDGLDDINPLAIITKNLGQSKSIYYDELVFPDSKRTQAIQLKKNGLILDKKIFSPWLPKTEYKDYIVYALIVVAILSMVAVASVFGGIPGLIIAAAVAAFLTPTALLTYMTRVNTGVNKTEIRDEAGVKTSHHFMQEKMPANPQPDKRVEETPHFNQPFKQSKERPSNPLDFMRRIVDKVTHFRH